jgi:hypothetical protein
VSVLNEDDEHMIMEWRNGLTVLVSNAWAKYFVSSSPIWFPPSSSVVSICDEER